QRHAQLERLPDHQRQRQGIHAVQLAPSGGPRVFLDYDQKALDDAYDQAVYAPNRDQVLARFAAASAIARKHLGEPQRFAYGPSELEKLDVFSCGKSNAPVNVFIHGGAWRQGLARNYAFPAEMFVRAGAHLVVLDFINVLESGGDLFPMADQVRRAVAWVHDHCGEFGGGRNRPDATPAFPRPPPGGRLSTT